MGIQSWKNGVHSGNTMRAGKAFKHRKHDTQPELVKRVVSPTPVVFSELTRAEERKRSNRTGGNGKGNGRVPDNHLESDELMDELDVNVVYSLNKKGRWNLPGMIKRDIRDTVNIPEVHIDMQRSKKKRSNAGEETREMRSNYKTLLEFHHSTSVSNNYCLGLYSTKPSLKNLKNSTSKTYINADSILKRGTNKKKSKKNSKKTTDEDVASNGDKSSDLPTVEYRASYPMSRTSYLQFSSGKHPYYDDLSGTRHSRQGIRCMHRQRPSRKKFCPVDEDIVDIENVWMDGIHETDDDDDSWWFDDKTAFEGGKATKLRKEENSGECLSVKENSYAWFLREFVRMPSSDELMSESETEEEEEEDKNDFQTKSDSSWEIIVDSETSECEMLENAESEDRQEEAESSTLEQFIENALLKKYSPVQIGCSQKKRKRNRSSTVNEQYLPENDDDSQKFQIVPATEKVIQVDDIRHQKTDPDTTSETTTNPVPIQTLVQVVRNDVAWDVLRLKFGPLVMRGNCLPETIVVDISKLVTSIAKQRRKDLEWEDMEDIECFLVLRKFNTYVCLTEDFERLYTSLYCNLNMTSIGLEDTVKTFCVYSLDNLITDVLKFVLLIPEECFPRKPCGMMYRNNGERQARHRQLNLLYETRKYDVVITPMKQFVLLRWTNDQEESNFLTSLNATDLEESDCDVSPPHTCSICLRTVIFSMATALLPCRHWFCNRCWADHVKSSVDRGCKVTTCMAHGCKSVANNASVLIFGGVTILRRHLNLFALATTTNIWCNNRYCDKILSFVPEHTNRNLVPYSAFCVCGSSFCTRCKKEDHWPASCHLTDNYLQMLKASGDDRSIEYDATFEVKVKRCPGCTQPLVTDHYCVLAVCTHCAVEFCWGCLKKHDGSIHRECQQQKIHAFGLESIFLPYIKTPTQSKAHRSKLYERALEHRMARQKSNLASLRMKAASVAAKVTIRSGQLIHDHVAPEEINLKLTFQQCVALHKRLNTRLRLAVDIFEQLHSACEFTCIQLEETKELIGFTCLDQMEFICTQIQQLCESKRQTNDRIHEKLNLLIESSQNCFQRLNQSMKIKCG